MDVVVYSVATGLYANYWMHLADSVDRYLFPGRSVEMVVFTDQVGRIARFGQGLDRAKVTPVETPSLGWPHATMDRYRLIAETSSWVSSDLAIHLDADMLVVRPTGAELDVAHQGLVMVAHPGYYRRSTSLLSQARCSPRTLASDILGYMRGEGGLGQWERRVASRAYVPQGQRRTYVCGGVWLGPTQRVLEMCMLLQERSAADEAQGLTARWHDESHLNWYAATNRAHILDPSYCYSPVYPHLEGLVPRILAVDKGSVRVRTAKEQK